MNYDDFRQQLGERVRALRISKGIKQEQLAELVNKSTEHISFIERSERSPSLELLIDISNALDVSVSHLLDIETEDKENRDSIPAPLPSNVLPNTVTEPIKPLEQRQNDLERLREGLENVKLLQRLANEYDISDIFQDNGGKVLQLLILLGLRQLKGREGNDAIDEDGNEYELKTVNVSLNPRAGVTTHPEISRITHQIKK